LPAGQARPALTHAACSWPADILPLR
jgi:hypothetical protein